MSPQDAIARANPPGERQLHFRVGTYRSFLQRMVAELPRGLPSRPRAPTVSSRSRSTRPSRRTRRSSARVSL